MEGVGVLVVLNQALVAVVEFLPLAGEEAAEVVGVLEDLLKRK